MDTVESFSQCSDLAGNMLTDEDYLNFMTDTLFSTITNHQPFAFPDCREIGKLYNQLLWSKTKTLMLITKHYLS